MAEHKADMGMNETIETNAQTGTPPQTTGPADNSLDEVKQRIRKMAQSKDEGETPGPPPLHDVVLDERNDIMHVINELEDQLDRQQEIREALERELGEANEKLQTATQRAQELEWQSVTMQTRLEGLEQVRQEVTLLEEEVASANGRVQRLTEEYNSIEKERTRLKNELKAANKQLEELWTVRRERDGLRGDLKNLSARLEELERNRRDWSEERAQLSARLQEAQTALEETRAERHQHQIMLRAAEDRSRELARVQEELADKIEAVRNEKKVFQAQLAHLERENARMVEQRQFYETELTSLRNTNRNAESALAAVKKAFAEVRVALTETKSRARRKMIETWPRTGFPLRGIDGADLGMASGDGEHPIIGTQDEAVPSAAIGPIAGDNGDR